MYNQCLSHYNCTVFSYLPLKYNCLQMSSYDGYISPTSSENSASILAAFW